MKNGPFLLQLIFVCINKGKKKANREKKKRKNVFMNRRKIMRSNNDN